MPWTYEPSLAAATQGLAAATCEAPSPGAGYRIYALGGDDGSGADFATAAAYDTLAKSWSTIAPMPTARSGLARTSGPGRLHALGNTAALRRPPTAMRMRSTIQPRTLGGRQRRSQPGDLGSPPLLAPTGSSMRSGGRAALTAEVIVRVLNLDSV
jgi:hypothetical protein